MQTIEFFAEPENGFFKIPEQYLNDILGKVKIIIISQPDKSEAELRPISNFKVLRPFGLCAGEFTVPDDFDAPLPEAIIQEFYGE